MHLLSTLSALLLASSALAAPLEPRQSTTRDDIINHVCKAVTVIFARGTTEAGPSPPPPSPERY